MADKCNKSAGMPTKPVRMNLFATWEVEKTTPNCIPRLCSLTLTRLVITKPLESELQSVIIAVKMQNSKRTLRSNDMAMPPNGILETELDLSFSLQYPHFLKRDGNKLQVMLQRRKKYKNRTFLGFKTLAMGQINMSQVLQHSVDRELNLYSDMGKDGSSCLVAQVVMLSLTSQPVDHEENGQRKIQSSEADRSPDVDASEDDEAHDDQDFSSNEDMSDSEPIADLDDCHIRNRKFSNRVPFRPTAASRQRNIKQKFISLLRRFRMSEEVLDSEQDQDDSVQGGVHNQEDLEDLFDELENLSESDPEMDTISVLSTPKPKLRPFFTGRGSSELLDMPRVGSFAYDYNRLHDEGVINSQQYDSDTNLENTSFEAESADPYLSHPHHLGNDTQPSTPVASEGGIGSKDETSSNCKTPVNSHILNKDRGPASSSINIIDTTASSLPTIHHQEATYSVTSVSQPRSYGSELGSLISTSASGSSEPHSALINQLGLVLSSDEKLPENLILVNNLEWQGQLLAQVLKEPQHSVVSTFSAADVKTTISFTVNKIQKFCNTNSRSPVPLKIVIAGGDSYVHSVLWPYVEQFSAKSPDWQTYIKFLFIPLGSTSLGRFLSILDPQFGLYFNDQFWKDIFDKSENSHTTDTSEIVKRVSQYISSASHLLQLPIAEAMLTYKDKNTEEESSQTFVPFINEAHVGARESATTGTSVDVDEPQPSCLSSSPPLQPQFPHERSSARDTPHTPPASPSVTTPASTPGHASSMTPSLSAVIGPPPSELLDLQLDYWSIPTKPVDTFDKSDRLQKKDSKSSLKTTFRSVKVYRLPQWGGQGAFEIGPSLSMAVVTKEKKQKILRMGKKSKDVDTKSQLIEAINRLICTSKSQNQPLTVSIDGVEWLGVKFFQISAQWQTHIKYFPLLIFGQSDIIL